MKNSILAICKKSSGQCVLLNLAHDMICFGSPDITVRLYVRFFGEKKLDG
jgi:hypothetical protein